MNQQSFWHILAFVFHFLLPLSLFSHRHQATGQADLPTKQKQRLCVLLNQSLRSGTVHWRCYKGRASCMWSKIILFPFNTYQRNFPMEQTQNQKITSTPHCKKQRLNSRSWWSLSSDCRISAKTAFLFYWIVRENHVRMTEKRSGNYCFQFKSMKWVTGTRN